MPEPEKKKDRNQPSANQGQPVFVYVDGATEPTFALVTHEHPTAVLDNGKPDPHAGYIDAMLFPRDAAPRPLQSIAPGDYVPAAHIHRDN